MFFLSLKSDMGVMGSSLILDLCTSLDKWVGPGSVAKCLMDLYHDEGTSSDLNEEQNKDNAKIATRPITTC